MTPKNLRLYRKGGKTKETIQRQTVKIVSLPGLGVVSLDPLYRRVLNFLSLTWPECYLFLTLHDKGNLTGTINNGTGRYERHYGWLQRLRLVTRVTRTTDFRFDTDRRDGEKDTLASLFVNKVSRRLIVWRFSRWRRLWGSHWSCIFSSCPRFRSGLYVVLEKEWVMVSIFIVSVADREFVKDTRSVSGFLKGLQWSNRGVFLDYFICASDSGVKYLRIWFHVPQIY